MSAERQNQTTIITSINPANDQMIGQVNSSSHAAVQAAVARARAAQGPWAALTLQERQAHIAKLIPLFQQNRDQFIKITSQEMGMPIGLSTDLVDGAGHELQWNLDHAEQALKSQIIQEDDTQIITQTHEPIGVMGCIVAWNFPLPNFVVSTSQALLAGNTVVMKYSEEVVMFQDFLQSIIQQAGLPEGVVEFVSGDGAVGAALSEADIDFISFTGSSATGRKLYQTAAARMMPVVMELGGSSPGIVFADADLDDAVEKVFWQRFLNSAQFCDGLKRLIIHNAIKDEFVAKLVAYAKGRVVGDPLDEGTELGPLVAERQVVKLEGQIADAGAKGAVIECGGQRPEGLTGAYYLPTILTNITFDMKVWTEEVFGPALPVVGFDSYEEAITLANDTEYGLSGFVYTSDQDTAQRAMRDIKAGSISGQNTHYFHPSCPFGGFKASGVGRTAGIAGFHSVTQIKVTALEK